MSDSPADTVAPAARLSLVSATFAGFAVIALVDAVCIEAFVPRPLAGLSVRLLHHAYDAGHLLAMGLASAALLAAWLRFRPTVLRRGVFTFALLAGLALTVGDLVLVEDLDNLAARISLLLHKEGHWPTILLNLLIGATAAGIPIAALVGWSCARPKLRWLPVALGVAAAVVNERILRHDYDGAHLFLAWAAALLAGVPLAGLEIPPRLVPGRRVRGALFATVGLASLASLLVRPTTNVLLQLYATPGSVLAPFIARLRGRAVPSKLTAAVPPEQAAWFRSRDGAPMVPSTAGAPRVAPIVILLGIDSVRADVLADETYLAELPELARLEKTGVYFTEARSAGPGTVFSYTAIFSSRYYSQLFWSDRHGTGIWAWRDPSPRFPELLARAGVATVDVGSILWFDGDWGVARGFTEQTILDPRTSTSQGTAAELVTALDARLAEAGDKPLFLFTHFMDAHYPYDRGRKDGTPKERFVSELAIVDQQIGRLRREIDRLGLAGRTTLIVTADHGEAFGEHDTTQHGTTLYEELLRVPLLVYTPTAKARRVDTPVSLIDLGPTILDLFGAPTPGTYMGQSLVPFLRGESPRLSRPILAEGRLKRALYFPDGLKVITDERRGTVELYDLKRDPEELRNLATEGSTETEPRVGAIDAFFLAHTLKKSGYAPPYRP